MSMLLAHSWRSRSAPPGEGVAASLPEWVTGGPCAGLAWNRLRTNWPPQTEPERRLAQRFRLQAAESLGGRWRVVRVWRRLEEAGLRPILIKGWSTARLYSDLALRPLGDVDLCFTADELPRAVELCDRFPDDFAAADLHRGVPDLPDRSWNEIFGRTRLEPLADRAIRVLGWSDHLRLTCRHFVRHGGRSPLMLCDVAAILESLPADFDWDQCLQGAAHETRWVLAVIGLAQRLLDAEVQDQRIAARAADLPLWLVPLVQRTWETDRRRRPMVHHWRRPRAALVGLRYRYLNPLRAALRARTLPRNRPQLAWVVARDLLRKRAVDLVKRPLRRLAARIRPERPTPRVHEDLD